MKLKLTLLLSCLVVFLANCAGTTPRHTNQSDVQTFIHTMVAKHGFKQEYLETLMAKAQYQPPIIDRITKPAEAMPWHAYRSIFLGRKRIRRGVQFLGSQRKSLEKAYRAYGIPANIITAILGVETNYGRTQGSIRVMDSLYTLAFHYSSRAHFFTGELEQYLLLTRKQKINPLSVKGSYAGAMGQPQFIASSYRHYAVDFNNNGRTDLWNETADAIGSVANYLARHGWKPGQPVAIRANVAPGVSAQTLEKLASSELKTTHTVTELENNGIRPQHPVRDHLPVGLLRLKGKAVPEFWLGAHNFYVITTYNHSALYAMAVYQLANAISRSAAHANTRHVASAKK